jgi:hypothetical protein
MLRIAVLSLVLSVIAPAGAQSVAERPQVKVGDRWSYSIKDRRAPSRTLSLEVVEVGDSEIRLKSVTNSGEFQVINTPEMNLVSSTDGSAATPHAAFFSFPMAVGKSWPVKYDWRNSNGNGTFEGTRKVEGIEKVTVPAGTFEAYRISFKGTYHNRANGNSGDSQNVDWYAPAARAMVKRERVQMTRGNIFEDSVWELTETSVKAGQ